MTRRARLMLDALEDGCQTRRELWAHADRFYLTNNAAADLRRAGVAVVFERGGHADNDRYVLNEGGRLDASPEVPREAVLVEHDTGQFAIEVAA